MAIPHERIAANIQDVRRRIAEAAARAGRPAEAVRLIAVTKTVGLEEVNALCDLGVVELGENRVQVAQPKVEALGRPVQWHMIGPIQRRKAKDVVSLFDCADAIDRLEVADALDKRCLEAQKSLDVLLEVNVSGEESKHGFTPGSLEGALEHVKGLSNLRVQGLMTMAPFVGDPEEARPVFKRLKALADQWGLAELSMGMTNDFEVAIEEGATQVRIGSALFA